MEKSDKKQARQWEYFGLAWPSKVQIIDERDRKEDDSKLTVLIRIDGCWYHTVHLIRGAQSAHFEFSSILDQNIDGAMTIDENGDVVCKFTGDLNSALLAVSSDGFFYRGL